MNKKNICSTENISYHLIRLYVLVPVDVVKDLFVHLGGFYLLMMKIFQKILRRKPTNRQRWFVGFLVYVLHMGYRFLLVMRKEIQ